MAVFIIHGGLIPVMVLVFGYMSVDIPIFIQYALLTHPIVIANIYVSWILK